MTYITMHLYLLKWTIAIMTLFLLFSNNVPLRPATTICEQLWLRQRQLSGPSRTLENMVRPPPSGATENNNKHIILANKSNHFTLNQFLQFVLTTECNALYQITSVKDHLTSLLELIF